MQERSKQAKTAGPSAKTPAGFSTFGSRPRKIGSVKGKAPELIARVNISESRYPHARKSLALQRRWKRWAPLWAPEMRPEVKAAHARRMEHLMAMGLDAQRIKKLDLDDPRFTAEECLELATMAMRRDRKGRAKAGADPAGTAAKRTGSSK